MSYDLNHKKIWNFKINNFDQLNKKIYSQNGEDGIIESIFHKIGTTNKFCIEFGIHIHESNTKYLKQNGWECLWMDGSGDGRVIKNEFITAENINELFKKRIEYWISAFSDRPLKVRCSVNAHPALILSYESAQDFNSLYYSDLSFFSIQFNPCSS